jgi:hypothetical protein
MIKLIEWLLGARRTEELRVAEREAERDVLESRAMRAQAERVGPVLRFELGENSWGDRIRTALHQEGWESR